MDDERTTARPASDAAREAGDVGANQSSGTARDAIRPDEAEPGDPVEATLRGEPGTPQAMGLGNDAAPSRDDSERELDGEGSRD
jgi:hypothetical protein